MPIRWDSLLARHVARELNEELAGARLRAIRFDRSSRDVLLMFEERSLLWRLHPAHGQVRLLPPVEPAAADYRSKQKVQRVQAPPDERVIRFGLVGGRSPDGGLVIELMGNQWNAFVVEGEAEVIRHALRLTRGRRSLSVGDPYVAPRPQARLGVDGALSRGEWTALLDSVSRDRRPEVLVRSVAWTSPLNALSLVAGEEAESGHARWLDMVTAAEAGRPVVLEAPVGPHPYPFPLAGVDTTPADTLLLAFARCAGTDDALSIPSPTVDPASLHRLEQAIARSRRRLRKLEAELEGLDDPPRLRALGDLILARYHEVPPGAAKASLTDFDGMEVDVELDPMSPAHENAARYYRRATRTQRAAERLPDMIERAVAEVDDLTALLARAQAGAVGQDEVEAALGPVVRRGPAGGSEPALPYRVYRSSGGLEIRVGRGARHNDDLTFRHSAPGDVWLHARHAAGAHVILRWPGPGNPPARDLREAATLAALHSKARTSRSVPVDWTLRKYVRKPRKAKSGSVVPDRVTTVFVEPAASLLDELAVEAGGATRRAQP